MVKKRQFTTFSLSFLDIMSCGFGAVILVFLIIKHDVDTLVDSQNVQLQAEVNLLEQEVLTGQVNLVEIKNTISILDQKLVQTNGLARQINTDIEAIRNKITQLDEPSDEQQILQLKQKIKQLQLQKIQLEDQQEKANNNRQFIGQGERQYLTGLQLGGKHTLILLDSSASMLDNTIVNIIRSKYLAESDKKQSSKWLRAINTIEWLIAKFPLQSQYQVFSFNQSVNATLPDFEQQWLNINDQQQLNQNIAALKNIIPGGGTNLEKAFRAVHTLSPLPDNIILITDGLPTMGSKKHTSNTVTGKQREALFELAVNALPQDIPVNVLLWPMEGDPMAASAFWKLAQYTSGSFLSPSKDWP